MAQIRHHTRHKKHKIHPALDKVMYVIALLGPIMTIPQVLLIWEEKSVAGLSITTWGTYWILSVIWLTYAWVHQEKPLILSNALYLMTNTGILVGIMMFHI